MSSVEERADFAEGIITYLLTRGTPWDNEQSMKEAVRLTVNIMLTEAAPQTRRLLRDA